MHGLFRSEGNRGSEQSDRAAWSRGPHDSVILITLELDRVAVI